MILIMPRPDALTRLDCSMTLNNYVLLSRFISVGIPYTLMGFGTNKTKLNPEFKEITVLTWSGLRGGLAFALSLSLINQPGGHFIIYITYVVVAFSIVVQGLTIGKLVTKLRLG